MAANKKPRKKYNPRKWADRPSRVSLDEAFRIFQPVRSVVSALLRGEVEVDERGYPLMMMLDGKPGRIDAALLGWAECWDRLFGSLDTAPLRKVSKKLELGVLLEESDLLAVGRLLDAQQAAFVRLSAVDVQSKMLTQEIAIEMESLGLVEEETC